MRFLYTFHEYIKKMRFSFYIFMYLCPVLPLRKHNVFLSRLVEAQRKSGNFFNSRA